MIRENECEFFFSPHFLSHCSLLHRSLFEIDGRSSARVMICVFVQPMRPFYDYKIADVVGYSANALDFRPVNLMLFSP